METVFLANHCVLEGYESFKGSDEKVQKCKSIVEECLQSMTEETLKVVRHIKEEGVYIVSIPKLSVALGKATKTEPKVEPKAEENPASQEKPAPDEVTRI